MSGRPADGAKIMVTVTAEGLVSAETRGITGEGCLDYIAVLEDLLAARTVDSAYTSDFTRAGVDVDVEDYQGDTGVEYA
jgi:hypothetical protein